jgi:hypothetical protein
MQKISNSFIALPGVIIIILLTTISGAAAQVVSPVEIRDVQLRALQQQYDNDLKSLGVDVLSIPTEYSFYLSRRLDLDEQKQRKADQRSIRFDRYKGRTVLEITGNYYAAYSAEKMSPEQRAKATFDAIILPILKIEIPRFQSNPDVQGYAFEISHHILGKVMDVPVEHAENLVAVLPQEAAIRLIGARDDNVKQAALLNSELYLNAQPVTIWLDGQGPQLAAQTPLENPDPATPLASPSVEVVRNNPATDDVTQQAREKATVAALGLPSATPLKPVNPPSMPRDISPQALASLQAANSAMVSALVKELGPQAHFVSYAAPSFVAFRKGTYLELSINTALKEAPRGSRYRLAALAFDDHVAQLIRPVLAYIKDDSQFDGIGFSTNIHLPGKSAAAASAIAVEFFFPFSTLRCYESYDCTGQQLIDAGTVLINGERAALDLQTAEAISGQ